MVVGSNVAAKAGGGARHPVLLALLIFLAPALWVLFVGTSNIHEMLAGLVSAIATVAFTIFVCRSSRTELKLRARDLAEAWRLPWYVVSDACVITLVLLRDLFGGRRAQSLYRVCGFDSSSHDPVRLARSILATAYTSVSPNSIVVGIDPSQSRMLFHQVESSPVTQMTRALGAKA